MLNVDEVIENPVPDRPEALTIMFRAILPIIAPEDTPTPEQAAFELMKKMEAEPDMGQAFDAGFKAIWMHGYTKGKA